MIKSFLDAVEENFNAAVMLFIFILIIAGIAAGVFVDIRNDNHDIEMAKLGCSQEIASTNNIPYSNYYIIWKCGNSVQEPK
jgi:hypothetical protein